MLIPDLRGHPLFATLAAIVSYVPRRGGWQVSVVALDPQLSATAAEVTLGDIVLGGLRQALAEL
jgi:hypothetical protein